MVVNGTHPSDWPAVAAWAAACPDRIIPSYGVHPWELPRAPSHWPELLQQQLDQQPAAVGETGLDRWKEGLPWDGQVEAFRLHLQFAAARNRPVSIHCLRAWGACAEQLEQGPVPACGVLLHSYGGSAEMADRLAKCGAYFSFCGAFAHPRYARIQAVFKQLPLDRILMETDAPDQLPPGEWRRYSLKDESGRTANHPANIGAVYAFFAKLRALALPVLQAQVAENFNRLFGPIHSAAR